MYVCVCVLPNFQSVTIQFQLHLWRCSTFLHLVCLLFFFFVASIMISSRVEHTHKLELVRVKSGDVWCVSQDTLHHFSSSFSSFISLSFHLLVLFCLVELHSLLIDRS